MYDYPFFNFLNYLKRSGAMKNVFIRMTFVLAGLLFFNSALLSQELGSKEISIKIKNASDPNGVFQNASSYIIKQKIFVTGGKKGEFDAEIKFKAPDNVRSSYFFKDKLVNSIIMKGQNAWMISGVDGAVSEITGNQLERLRLFHLISSPKSMLCDIFDEVRVDRVKIKDEELFQVFCRHKNDILPQITFFVGAGDFLQRRMLTVNEKGEPYTAEIVKYSIIENVFIPAETNIISGGIKQKITLEKFLINPVIDDSEFSIKGKLSSK